jgi:hypothetical protein
VQDGRIHIELINAPFMEAGGTPAEYSAGLDRAITRVGYAGMRAVCLMAANWETPL